MTTDLSVTATRFAATGPEHCIAKRDDGVYADPSVLGTTLVAAIDNVYRAGNYFTGIDYPVLMKALFGHGPELPQGPDGTTLVRFAADIQTFDPARRALYRAVKIGRGHAEYYFEPVLAARPGRPRRRRLPDPPRSRRIHRRRVDQGHPLRPRPAGHPRGAGIHQGRPRHGRAPA
ncbi:hypothetical protein ACL58G_14490 [Massilia sp. GER05]|uniref:hypothetical protein n=1 Tax=Massilia sp. GER05 TaxID=3394605 RepID=UPI003F873B9E